MDKLLLAYSILFLFACSNTTTSENSTSDNSSENDETKLSFFDAKQDFEIISFEQSIDESAAAGLSEELKATVCEGWSFTSEECKTTLSEARVVSSEEWHHSYDHLPCIYSGKIKQQGNTYQYEFNSGDWFVVFNADSSMYLANGEPEAEH